MTERNLKEELGFSTYYDATDGRVDTIDYELLIFLLEEILTRIDKLERNKNE